ncbi:hypothetical protein GW17_00009986 [Ensete ventricosum]|nr:hypothetical protein GW17_00009986 [Ensete ventricosum]RZR96201.1 hypothetical protein BHM03_00025190 [Ensete ventricosum]
MGAGVLVGYWPTFLFSHLAVHANMVQFGGEIVNTRSSGYHTSTQMGSGHFAAEGFRRASYFRNLQLVDWDNSLIPLSSNLRLLADHPSCYTIQGGVSGTGIKLMLRPTRGTDKSANAGRNPWLDLLIFTLLHGGMHAFPAACERCSRRTITKQQWQVIITLHPAFLPVRFTFTPSWVLLPQPRSGSPCAPMSAAARLESSSLALVSAFSNSFVADFLPAKADKASMQGHIGRVQVSSSPNIQPELWSYSASPLMICGFAMDSIWSIILPMEVFPRALIALETAGLPRRSRLRG